MNHQNPDPLPPRLAQLLLRLLLPARTREFVTGDLCEMFARRVAREGHRAARRWYWRAAMSCVVAGAHRGGGGVPVRHAQRRTELLWDLRIAARTLWRSPAFASVAALTIALGIGTATAVFAIANQIMLQPLPGVHEAERAAYLDLRAVGARGFASFNAEGFEALRAAESGLEGIAAYGYLLLHVKRGEARPVGVTAQTMVGDYFEVLGVRPAAGRLLRADETGLGSDPSLAVISERLWSSMFEREAAAIGSTIQASGYALTVIGVAGDGFLGAERANPVDLWVPVSHPLARFGNSLSGTLVARLGAGQTKEAAEARLEVVTERLAVELPDQLDWLSNFRLAVHPGLRVTPGYEDQARRAWRALAATILLVLLIACANTANLLLFRGAGRQGEVAVRRALGATRARVMTAHLAESLILALAGACIGAILALALAELFRGERFLTTPQLEGLAPDLRVLLFVAAVSVTVAVACGAFPAWAAAHTEPMSGLRRTGARAFRRRSGVRTLMTSSQVAVSLTLLTGALLLARTVRNIYDVDPGYDASSLYALGVNAGPAGYSADDADRVNRQLLSAVRAVPGVEAAALDAFWPLQGASLYVILRPEGASDDAEIPAQFTYVSPGYFETLRMPVESGRAFRDDDWSSAGAERVILSRSAARQLFDGVDPVGRTIQRTDRDTPENMVVIGVVADARMSSPTAAPTARLYRSIAASPGAASLVVLRAPGAEADLAQRLARAVATVAPDLPPSALRSFRSLIDDRIAERRLLARLLAVLSALAVGLAAVGLYATVAYGVAERRAEIGVRMALGARRSGIIRLVVRQATLPLTIGLFFGLLGASALAHLLANHLFGVARLEPGLYVAAVALVGIVAAGACVLPGRSATRVDPASAMRVE